MPLPVQPGSKELRCHDLDSCFCRRLDSTNHQGDEEKVDRNHDERLQAPTLIEGLKENAVAIIKAE